MSEDRIQVDGVYRHRKFHNDTTQELTEQERNDDLPEDLMDKLQEYYGDGDARITVGGKLSSSVSFHGCEAFCSIGVSCNTDADTIQKVHDLLQPQVAKFVEEDLVEMSKLRDPWLAPADRLHSKAKAPPKKGPTSLPPEEGAKTKGPPKKRGSSIKTKKGVKKPKFQR